jgi:hypothetical protein
VGETGFDLSGMPEPLRQKFQARLDLLPPDLRARLLASLARLPPAARAEVLSKGSATLDKLLGRIERTLPANPGRPLAPTVGEAARITSRQAPSGFYSQTVQRGDRRSLPLGVIVLLAAGVALTLYQMGLLGS